MATPKKIKEMSAPDILNLLKQKHAHNNDVMVPECKNGESYALGLLRLDLWVLRRTWSPWTTIGYEIKVSRKDFEADQKWGEYLGLCHEFYFVCPPGLIKEIDLRPGVGLIWVSVSGDRLHTKVKAQRHLPDSEKLVQLMSYVVMSRSVIVKDMNEANKGEVPDRLAKMANQVETATERAELAELVRGHIRQRLHEMSEKVRNADMKESQVKRFTERLKQLGITWDADSANWIEDGRVEDEIRALRRALDWQTLSEIKSLGQRLQELAQTIKEIREADKREGKDGKRK